jgi:predicted DNA-binding protein (MmcQ/YjbR family)
MFALVSLDEVPATANLKCDPDLALELRDRFEQVQPGYHMNKKHWNTVDIEELPDAELHKMIDHSFDLVVQNCRASVSDAKRKRAASQRRPTTRAARPRRSPTAKRRGRR